MLDFKVTTCASDQGQLDNMAIRAKKLLEVDELEALADKGYYNAKDLKKCLEKNITPYVPNQVHSNGTGDRDFYSDKFKYDNEKDIYLCPNMKELHKGKNRSEKGKIIGTEYKNKDACAMCELRDRCTRSKNGRSIFRAIDQDILDKINLMTELNNDKYRMRQMLVEHPFGTIKRTWGAYYFLTRGMASVTAEMAMSFLVYNFRRLITILGAKKMLQLLNERHKPILA